MSGHHPERNDLDAVDYPAALVADGLERSDGLAERVALPGVVEGEIERPLCVGEASGDSRRTVTAARVVSHVIDRPRADQARSERRAPEAEASGDPPGTVTSQLPP